MNLDAFHPLSLNGIHSMKRMSTSPPNLSSAILTKSDNSSSFIPLMTTQLILTLEPPDPFGPTLACPYLLRKAAVQSPMARITLSSPFLRVISTNLSALSVSRLMFTPVNPASTKSSI